MTGRKELRDCWQTVSMILGVKWTNSSSTMSSRGHCAWSRAYLLLGQIVNTGEGNRMGRCRNSEMQMQRDFWCFFYAIQRCSKMFRSLCYWRNMKHRGPAGGCGEGSNAKHTADVCMVMISMVQTHKVMRRQGDDLYFRSFQQRDHGMHHGKVKLHLGQSYTFRATMCLSSFCIAVAFSLSCLHDFYDSWIVL